MAFSGGAYDRNMPFIKRYLHTAAPFSAVIEYANDFFLEHPRLHIRSLAGTRAAVDVHHSVVSDLSDTARLHDAIVLSWQPRLPLFPDFAGCVSVRPHFKGSMLAIEGSYEPPFGKPGRIFDRFAGRMLAFASLDFLLYRLRASIERRYRTYVKSCPTIEQLNARAPGSWYPR